MAYSKLEDTFHLHTKFKRLARELKIRRAEARGLMACLYSWAVTHAPDGDLRQFEDLEIEEHADWEGSAGKFVPAAHKCGLFDKKRQGYVLHDYYERASTFRKAQQKRKERRRRQSATVATLSRDSEATVASDKSRVEMSRDERSGGDKTDDHPPISTNSKPWKIGQPIVHPSQWEHASADLGISIQPTRSERATAFRVISAGAVEPYEYENALKKLNGKGANYFFAIIEGERRDALEQQGKSSPAPVDQPKGRGWSAARLDEPPEAQK